MHERVSSRRISRAGETQRLHRRLHRRLVVAGASLAVATGSALVAAPASAEPAQGAPASAEPAHGTVVGWGQDGDGQASPPAGLAGVVDVAGGQLHSLALRADGTVVGWGWNSAGQTDPPDGLTDVARVEAGAYFSVALREDGTVVAWGVDWDGESSPPEGLADVVDISAGGSHGLALTEDGTVHSWGAGWSGETAVPAALSDVVDVAAGGSHSLAVREDGTVVGWGSDLFGAATPPEGLTDAVAVAAGTGFSLALRADGTVVAWGRDVATPPAGLTGVVDLDAGVHHAVALKDDGTVVAWGEDDAAAAPPDLAGVSAVAAGGLHSLAVVGAADTVAPVVIVPGGRDVTATSADGAAVTFPAAAEDGVDGALPAICDPASGGLLPLGTTTVTCTATDAAGNTATASFVVAVTYAWSGFERPLCRGADLRAGSTVPVTFSLVGESAGIADATATLWFTPVGDDGRRTAARTRTGEGNAFRYDADDDRYVFAWSTKGLRPGRYVLTADLGDGVERSAEVTLR